MDAVLQDSNGSAITRYSWQGWDHQPRNQQWYFTDTGQIMNAWNGHCLDADPAPA
ncbi:hypothetical protein ACFVHI_23100 [Kitasatospora sp. NPDC127121]|uniref:hypothetical protein n=1 Tax=Kitasatospora sp. NPDC127121 TaxID=3345371 RepID=UPI003645505D